MGYMLKKKMGQITFYLIEFKKMDLDNPQNIVYSYYFLDSCRTICKQDCQFSKVYNESIETLKTVFKLI